MRIKAILFDIDNTLFPSSEFSEMARRNALRAMIEAGMKADFRRAMKELEKIVAKQGPNSQNHFDLLVARFGAKGNKKLIAAGIAAYHNAKASILPYPEVPRTLLALRHKGYKLYCATEGSSIKQWDKLIRLGLHHFFDDVFVSDEIGHAKGKKFFSRILKKLKLKPEECVVVGDKMQADITPAMALGIKTVRVLAGKYAKQKGKSDFEIRKMDSLLKILK